MEKYINSLPLILVVLVLAVGFTLLVKGADYFVEGSSSVAKRFNVPSLIIGLTIVAMGTSLPETAVSVTASLIGNNTLAISNVTGSNIFNLMVVIGVCACMAPVHVQRDTVIQDIPFSVFCAFLMLTLGYVTWGGDASMSIGRFGGIVMLCFFAAYMVVLIRRALKTQNEGIDTALEAEAEMQVMEDVKILPMGQSIIYILCGAAAIAFGGDITVDAASKIAIELGMSQTLVGLTIVSIGTSLPELVTSIVAARKDEVDMALGNAIGSNIFNILMVIGIASVISPIDLITENLVDIGVLVAFSFVVWLFSATKHRLSRGEGIVMILMYLGYAAYIIIR